MRTRIFFSVNNTDYLLVTNYRIIEFLSSHGISRIVTDFLFFFSCPELSRLVLGPTDQREVIIEFCLHTEYHGQSRIFFSSFLVPNYRIIEFLSSHGISQTVTDFLSRIIEFQSHGISRTVTDFSFFCHELENYRIFVFRDTPRFSV